MQQPEVGTGLGLGLGSRWRHHMEAMHSKCQQQKQVKAPQMNGQEAYGKKVQDTGREDAALC